MCNHWINFNHNLVVYGPCQLFQQETTLLATDGHNCHKNVGPVQEGGTLMLAFDEIAQSHRPSDLNQDPTGLGQWASMPFISQQGHTTRVVMTYNPCQNAL